LDLKINTLHNKAVGGNKKAEEELFSYLSVRFKLFVQQRIWDRLDAEEIVQDTMMTIAKKYRELDIEISFNAWAHAILENNILNYFRKKKHYEKRLADLSASKENAPSYNPDPILKRKLLDCLKKVGQANQRYARILNLHYQGYSTEEICRRLKLTRNHSYVLFSRAKSMLKRCLEKGDIE
jgi:RNA polymerase sigma-70 factor (ECF subfamily)